MHESTPRPQHRIDTTLVHAGETPRVGGAVILPIFQSATFEYAGQSDYHDLKYIRLNNTPNHAAAHAKIAALEGAEAALVTASGMAAISTALLTVLSAGDHVLALDCLYGGTRDFITTELRSFGITFDFIDGNDPDGWARKLRPNTKAVYVESMTNPLLQVPDLAAVAAFAKANGILSIIDNTFATPVNYQPLRTGFDLVLHSCTKYLNGHSDLVAGACAGRSDLIRGIKHRLNHLGGALDPHAAFLLTRGMKTLALRVRHQNRSTLAIAEFLEAHQAVARVHYPGLPSHPAHARARGLFAGFGGVLAFELAGGVAAADRFLSRVTIPIVAPSLGGVETLVTRPATTSHSCMLRADRERIGITEGLIRLSVGIEATEDLTEDLGQALAGIGESD